MTQRLQITPTLMTYFLYFTLACHAGVDSCGGTATAANPRSGDGTDRLLAEWITTAQRASMAGDHRAAVDALTQCVEQETSSGRSRNLERVYYLRGREYFRLGDAKASLRDFQELIGVAPNREPGLWERGISCYYAEEYAIGVKQFERYQRFDSTDVENAVWHFLCNAKQSGLETARARMLNVRADRRVPMTEIFQLFAGNATIDDVLKSAGASQRSGAARQRSVFYANLYIGLYLEVIGSPAESLKYMRVANENRIDHYMGDVARIHLMLRRSDGPSPSTAREKSRQNPNE